MFPHERHVIRRVGWSLVIVIVVMAAAKACRADDLYIITDLGVLPGATSSVAYAMNNAGEVVGKCGDRVFLWRDGEMTELWTGEEVTAINDSTEVVGWINDDGIRRAVVWRDGGLIELEVHDEKEDSRAYDINSSGVIAGEMGGSAVLWQDGAILGIIFPGGALGINDAGQVLGGGDPPFVWANGFLTYIYGAYLAADINAHGWVIGTTGPHGPRLGYVWDGNTMTLLGELPRGDESLPYAINDVATVVGAVGFAYDDDQAVIWRDGEIQRLEHSLLRNPGWTNIGAQDINNHGQIAGYGKNPNGEGRAILLTPTSPSDVDADGDVDLADYAALQNAFTGPTE